MISYFIQIVMFQFLLLGLYDLLLKKETFFQLNRTYLLLAPIAVMILPLIEFSRLEATVSNLGAINLPEILISNPNETAANFVLSIENIFLIIWVSGMVISSFVFLKKLIQIRNLRKNAKIEIYKNHKVVIIPNTDAAFTFLKTIFLGDNLSEKQKEDILLHEIVHVRQNHSVDLLIYEVLKAVLWFNPSIYLLQKRMATLQEFIADASVVQQIEKQEYYENLLSKLFQTENISFINTFFNQSLIKKRIIMLQKSKSKKNALIKYFAIFPLIGAMIFYTSCVNGAQNERQENSEASITETTKMQDKELRFKDIDKVPVYPGCEGMSKNEAQKCFTQNVAQHVVKEFSKDITNPDITGRQRIVVKFIIGKNGEIKDVTADTDFKELQDEAIRVAKTLPKMIPGEHKGKKVAVQFALPILFEI